MARYIKCIIVFVLILLISSNAYAIGDGNIDSGGGGMSQGTSQNNKWSVGDEGVRVSVIRISDQTIVATPADYTNKIPKVQMHFGRVSKIEYRTGAKLTASVVPYQYAQPVSKIPKIVTSASGHSSIEEIKRYFCSEYMVKLIAESTGIPFETLTNGEYKILLEPVAYVTYNGIRMAMTATEAAYYSRMGTNIRDMLPNVLFKNVPLSMFLEIPDLGYPAWSGPRDQLVTEDQIISSLGLGIIHFKEHEPEQGEVVTYDYVYRVNTQVITSVTVRGGQSDPDYPASVRFNIKGKNYTVNQVYYPEGSEQLAWIRWTTPETPQDITIQVSGGGGGYPSKGTIHVKVVDLDKNPPPNPVADDRNDSYVKPTSLPSNSHIKEARWSIWRPWWHEYWVYHDGGEDEDGYWEDEGWWEFDQDWYQASLSGGMDIFPDEKNPTATGDIIKSGYGINQEVTADVGTTLSSAVTGAQNAVTYFPEFHYQTYWRLLERISGDYHARFEFKENEYSTFSRRTHFTPIWMPDGTYTAYTWLLDCWTPKGMLSLDLSDDVDIQGDLWLDWHIGPVSP